MNKAPSNEYLLGTNGVSRAIVHRTIVSSIFFLEQKRTSEITLKNKNAKMMNFFHPLPFRDFFFFRFDVFTFVFFLLDTFISTNRPRIPYAADTRYPPIVQYNSDLSPNRFGNRPSTHRSRVGVHRFRCRKS